MSETERTIFVDESIHDKLGFVVTALVVAHPGVGDRVANALMEHGFLPEVDEFKSGAQMVSNPRMQQVRDAVLDIAASATKIAVLVSPAVGRWELGAEILRVLALVGRRNGLSPASVRVVLDQGLFRSRAHAEVEIARVRTPIAAAIEAEQDSRRRLGLQVADGVAHTVAQILRQELVGQKKLVAVGSESGYVDGTEFELGWAFLMNLRQAFFTRPLAYAHLGDRIDPERNPVLIGPEDDPVECGQHPHLLGWGVFISDKVDREVRAAAETLFKRIWLGCIH